VVPVDVASIEVATPLLTIAPSPPLHRDVGVSLAMPTYSEPTPNALEPPTASVYALEPPTASVVHAVESPTASVVHAVEPPTTSVDHALELPTASVVHAVESYALSGRVDAALTTSEDTDSLSPATEDDTAAATCSCCL